MLAISALVATASVEIAIVRVLPGLDPLVSTRPLARQIHEILPLNSSIYDVGNVNRNCDYGLRFYFDENDIPQFQPGEAADYLLVGTGGDMTLNDLGLIHRKIVAKFLPYCWVESVQLPEGKLPAPTAPVAPKAEGAAGKK